MLTDYLWFPVHKVGDRILKLVPEKILGYSNFWAWWKRVESEAGVRHRKPHMMRHTFATDVLDATEGSLDAVQGPPRSLFDQGNRNLSSLVAHAYRGRLKALGEYRRRAPAKTSLSTMHKTPAYRAKKGDERIRTAVRGFAGLCLTTRPRRPGRGR